LPHGADDWEELPLPEIERRQKLGKEVVFRARPRGRPGLRRAGDLRGAGRAWREVRHPHSGQRQPAARHRGIADAASGKAGPQALVWYKGILYQAASWKTARRVVAKVEFHFGELFPRVGFIVTNLETDSRRVVRFYNKRGTAEQ
jgi:hypothetical protein